MPPAAPRSVLRIDGRYTGPPTSANGGVSCGLLIAFVDAPAVEVTLRRPPPLDVDLRVAGGDLYDGEQLVASARPGAVELEPHPPVTVAQALAAEASYAGLTAHPFPGCFVCGTDRAAPDGLGLRPGPVAPGTVATTWTPMTDDAFLVWAALDCPGGWAEDVPGRPLVLGRMTLELHALPAVGAPHVVIGWVIGREGRKTFSGTALYDAGGTLLALAQQTWFAVDVATLTGQA
ncbi:MAG: hypothetical protein JJD92_05175 [Frankiaceae bacterium]|nr:hypothetical protein [Frankiaceae bacterium]